MRRVLMAGNWKMHLTLAGARELLAGIVEGLAALPRADGADVVVCPPFVYLFPAAKALAGSSVALGAQNLFEEPEGAFTGEISASMIADTGARYVILGHSERRHTIGHHEDDAMINRKVRAARAAGLTPILCVGETAGERDAGRTFEMVNFQLRAGLLGNEPRAAGDLVVAYEPVWAIGTGRNATPQQAQEVHAFLRRQLRELVGEPASQVRILYGGSLKPENAADLMAQPDVDGGLIGGASLKAASFVGIVSAALASKGISG